MYILVGGVWRQFDTKPFEVELLIAELGEPGYSSNRLYRISYNGILADDDGDLVWEGVVGIETGLSMTAIPVEVSLVDLAGNQAKRTSTTRVTVDTTAEFVNINVEVQNVVAAGQSVVVSGQALPGGAAAFSIDGIVEDVAMEETEEGVYTGSYIAKAGDLTDRATITIS